MDNGRKRSKTIVCTVYIATFVVLASFLAFLLLSNQTYNNTLIRLKEDVTYLKKVLSSKEKDPKLAELDKSGLGCISGDTKGSVKKSTLIGCDSKEMQSFVDSILAPKLNTIQNDVVNLREKLKNSGCDSQPSSNYKPIAITNGRVNFAADELGARINNVLAKPIGGSNVIKNILGLDFNANPPINLLRSGLAPGACFGFIGASASVSIRLAKTILVDEIALTHVPKEMTPQLSVDNAPKDFEIHGFLSNGKKELLGQWVYDNTPTKRTQNYKIINNNNAMQNLIFKVNSNHGANTTCVYGLEVYGKLI